MTKSPASNLTLCYLALPGQADPDAIEMAHRYWAIRPDGKVLYATSDLCRQYGFRSMSAMTKAIASIVTALQICRCGRAVVLTCRSELRAHQARGKCSCHPRFDAKTDTPEARTRQKMFVAYRAGIVQARTNYLEVPYSACLVLRALHKEFGDTLVEDGSLERTLQDLEDARHLRQLLISLYEQGVLYPWAWSEDDPTLNFSDGGVSVDAWNATFRMVPHINGSYLSPLAIAVRRAPADAEAVLRLWYDLAIHECLLYLEDLFDQELFGLRLNEESAADWDEDSDEEPYLGDEITDAIRASIGDALETNCIAQVWHAIGRVIKDAVAKVKKGTHSAESAISQIPADLATLFRKDKRSRYWLDYSPRPASLSPSSLFDVFQEQYGLDENCNGADAATIIAQATAAATPDPQCTEFGQTLRDLMHEAAQAGLTAEVMLFFAQCQRDRMPMAETLAFVIAAFPTIHLAVAVAADVDDD